MSCAVGVRPSSSPSRRSCADELLARREPARHQPGGALGRVPGAEVLDHRLRMHPRLRIGRELLHRRRAAEPLRRGPQLLEDLLVGVAAPDPGLELGERLRVDLGDRAIRLPRHTKNGRASWRKRKCELVGELRIGSDRPRLPFAPGAPSDPAVARVGRPPRGGRALAPRRPRRRDDPAREAALEARPGRDRPARRPAAAGLGRSSRRRTARRRRRRWWRRSCGRGSGSRTTARARTSSPASPPPSSHARGAELGLFEVDEAALPEVARRLRPRALLARQPLPRPARPLRRARARRRALARRRRVAARRASSS